MANNPVSALQQFKNQVGLKFQLYNSLFTSLPFHRIEKTGILLSMLLSDCEEGFAKKLSPEQIIDDFLRKHTTYTSEKDRLDLLFRFVQYVERQVVLFDALEDAAFRDIQDMNGPGTMKHLASETIQENKQQQLAERLKDFNIRLVLTAHPTQFYPGSVLGIINDLSKALNENNTGQVNSYLQQLGKTPFFNKQKPTPYDEAISLVWYLEKVFYPATGKIVSELNKQFPGAISKNNPLIRMGFWPGGDRDGNPFVKYDTTLRVASALRGAIIKCYYLEIRRLKRRLTFEGVENVLVELERLLYENLFLPGHRTMISKEHILNQLAEIRQTIIDKHSGLFLHLVESLIHKVNVFGLNFASLDIRQESSVHGKVIQEINQSVAILPADYEELDEAAKISVLSKIDVEIDWQSLNSEIAIDTLRSMSCIREIQEFNGEAGCNRYIISQCNSPVNIAEVFALLRMSGWRPEDQKIDVIPLFETVDDLAQASQSMALIYGLPWYRAHLQRRDNRQTIMLGFSDGTKDGGYLMANWSIYKAKKELTQLSREQNFDVMFFDGRGGPPARGGGKTHKFYASMGRDISNSEIQLTIQGQTISSNFGTIDSAQFNMEQILNAGIGSELFSVRDVTLEQDEESLLEDLATAGFEAYCNLKNHPDFLDYLANVSPLKFYSETNIGSRPAKRGASNELAFKDLRAIPFVGAWSQLKQNVTGYFGVGAGLQKMEAMGKLDSVRQLYQNSLFFRTLMDNCEMAMQKCFFPLTEHLAHHPRYSEIWNLIYFEFELTRKYLFKLSGKTELMADYPVEKLSVEMRERIVLPLTTIQQFALGRMERMAETVKPKSATDASENLESSRSVYEKLAMRCSFGIINAGRNSA